MKIHHITDLHVVEEDAGEQFAHVRSNVLRQLDFVRREKPDLLVISGDLTMPDASRSACQWIADNLPEGIECLVIPGNHDDPAVLYEVFGEARCVNQDFCFYRDTPHARLLFVNTTTDSLPPEQIAFLAEEGAQDGSVLFIHHPPDLVSDGFMSKKQPLLNHAELGDVIRASGISDVFCGHYHNVIDKDCDGFMLHLSPSPAFQISLTAEAFQMEELEPRVRVIEVGQGGVSTYIEEV